MWQRQWKRGSGSSRQSIHDSGPWRRQGYEKQPDRGHHRAVSPLQHFMSDWLEIERLEEREILCLTLTLDHDLIDGTPAARFAERLKELIEGAAQLLFLGEGTRCKRGPS